MNIRTVYGYDGIDRRTSETDNLGNTTMFELDAFGRGFESWDRHKRWVNRNKKWVNVDYTNLSVFGYPGENDLLLMQFEQSYRSDNYNVDSTKELYWSNGGGQWQIVYEGKRAFPAADGPVAAN